MRTILIISVLICLTVASYSQTNAKWKTGNEAFVVSYEVKQSADQAVWSTIKTILPSKLPDSNWYSYILPTGAYYYKVVANMVVGNYSTSAALNATNSVTITSPLLKTSFLSDGLSWTTTVEQSVSFYQVDKTTDNVNFSKVTTVAAKGNTTKVGTKYSYSVFRFLTKKPTYRLTPVFINGATGNGVNFK